MYKAIITLSFLTLTITPSFANNYTNGQYGGVNYNGGTYNTNTPPTFYSNTRVNPEPMYTPRSEPVAPIDYNLSPGTSPVTPTYSQPTYQY